MTLRHHVLVGTVGCFILLVTGLSAQTLQIIDADGKSTTLTAAQISNLPRVSVNTVEHDVPAQFEGVSVASVLAIAGIQMGDKLRGPRMAEVLLVEAADGYKVVFALAELDPAFATREIVLADKRDGKQLDSKQGPFRVVAPGDKRPARWIRQVLKMQLTTVK